MKQLILTPYPSQAVPKSLEHTVITPNPRASAALGAPPLSLDQLAAQVLERQNKRVASSLASRRLLFGVLEAAPDVDDVQGLASQLETLMAEVQRTGVALEPIQTLGERGRLVARIAEQYAQALERAGLISQERKLWAAAELIRSKQDLFVTGYPRVGQADLHFLNAIADENSTFILPYTSHRLFDENRAAATFLERRGWAVKELSGEPLTLGERLSERFTTSQRGVPEVTANVFGNQEEEVRAVLRAVKSHLLKGAKPKDIVLISRQESLYGPLVRDVAHEYGISVDISAMVPLLETRVGAWLTLLGEVVASNFPFELTARLLKHPLATGLSEATWLMAKLLRPNDQQAWANIGLDLSSFELPQQATRAQWAERLATLLREQGVMASIDNSPDDLAVVERVLGAFSASASDEMLNRTVFLAELKQVLRFTRVSFHPAAGGVELHSPLAIFGARYKYLFALGCVEGGFPQSIQDSAFLDFHERSALAADGFPIETAALRAQRERLSVWAVLQSVSEHLYLSYPQLLAGQEQLPSSLFADLGNPPRASRQTIVASQEELRQLSLHRAATPVEPVLTAAQRAYTAEMQRESSDPHSEFDGRTGVALEPDAFTFSATQLRRLGQCPFRWFSEQVLGLKELQEADDELSPAMRGKLYHKSLELAVKAASGREDLRAEILKELDDALRQAEQQELMSVINWQKQRSEHLTNLRLAVSDKAFLADDHTVAAVEEKFETTWNGLQVKGIVDRVDKGPEGNFVKDYKTGASKPTGVKDARGYAKIDIQLPIYLHATKTHILPDQPVAGGHYYSLTSRGRRELAKAAVDEEALTLLAAQVKAYLKEGFFPVDPDVEEKACAYCSYASVCRKGPRLERKRISHANE